MTVSRSVSCAKLPSYQTAREDEINEYELLEEELECMSNNLPNNSQKENHPQDEEEWQWALQVALEEKHRLLCIIRKYQKLVIAYKNKDYQRYSCALDCSFRQRGLTAESYSPPNFNFPMTRCSKEVETTNSLTNVMDDQRDSIEMIQPSLSTITRDKTTIHPWMRKSSASSSFLYAGVESPVLPLSQSSLDTSKSFTGPPSLPNVAFKSLERICHGTWLYKYPRKQYAKLINQTTIPMDYLHYRYFFVNPFRATICWSDQIDASVLKQVQIMDFYTEQRLLPKEELDDESDGQPAIATIIIVLTEQEKPLTLVPTTSEELNTWVNALCVLIDLRRSEYWPTNLIIRRNSKSTIRHY